MYKVGVIHATMDAVEPLNAMFWRMEPDVTVLNFVNEYLLFRANEKGGADEEGLHRFVRILLDAADAGVDGIIVACSVYTPFAGRVNGLTSMPVIGIDAPMLERAVEIGGKIGILATTAPSAPSAQRQMEKFAASRGKTVEFRRAVVTEAMTALKAGDVPAHNRLLAETGRKLLSEGCDVLVLSQITMACAADGMKDLGIPVLTSPREGVREIMYRIREKRENPAVSAGKR